MSQKEYLIIKRNENSFERFYSGKFKENNCDVLDINQCANPRLRGVQRRVDCFFKVNKLSKKYHFNDYKKVIVFDDFSLLFVLRFFVGKNNLILWLWNILESNQGKRINFAKKVCNIWTFDYYDSQKYGLELNSQIVAVDRKECNSDKNYIFFVGQDKGRMECLQEIEKKVNMTGLKVNFNIIADKDKIYNKKLQKYIVDEFMEYDCVLKYIRQCSIVVDLVQAGQSGLTVRALEALCYGKKILTNNLAIENMKIYNPNNVFIIGKDSWNDFQLFLNQPYIAYKEELVSYYSISNWLRRF